MRSLSANSKATGLKINSQRTRLHRLNTTNNQKGRVYDRDINDVESFVYLGAHFSSFGGMEDDIKGRLDKVRAAYSKLEKVWKNSQFTTKKNNATNNVISVLLHDPK